jgi:hypothetical protein
MQTHADSKWHEIIDDCIIMAPDVIFPSTTLLCSVAYSRFAPRIKEWFMVPRGKTICCPPAADPVSNLRSNFKGMERKWCGENWIFEPEIVVDGRSLLYKTDFPKFSSSLSVALLFQRCFMIFLQCTRRSDKPLTALSRFSNCLICKAPQEQTIEHTVTSFRFHNLNLIINYNPVCFFHCVKFCCSWEIKVQSIANGHVHSQDCHSE